MNVVDISAWQENVDWQRLVDAGVEGVINNGRKTPSFSYEDISPQIR